MDRLRRWTGAGLTVLAVACSSASHSKVDGAAASGADAMVAAKDSGAGGSGGLGGTSTLPIDASLGGNPGSGGSLASGGETAGVMGGGGQVGPGGKGGGETGNGGQAGSLESTGGIAGAVDGAAGGVVGSGGGSSVSGGSGGGLGSDAGLAFEVLRSETAKPACGTVKGTIGGSATEASSLQRRIVVGTDCHEYIVQNNNFANPTGSVQTLSYSGASFEVVASTASRASGSRLPASFPSIYIGGSAPIANGTYLTWSDSNLPIQIGVLTQALTTFDWSGGAAGGDFAASYDVWFAKAKPIAGSYDGAISGSLMIWLNKPSKRSPGGQVVRQASLAGHSWDVWVGPHGLAGLGTDDANRPVVTYVAKDGPLSGLAFDLATFIADVVANGSTDMGAAGTSQAFASTWYLTDVIAGFQIWSGGDATGLRCSGFACQVK